MQIVVGLPLNQAALTAHAIKLVVDHAQRVALVAVIECEPRRLGIKGHRLHGMTGHVRDVNIFDLVIHIFPGKVAGGFLVENHRAVAQGHYIQILGHIDVAFNAHGLVMTVEHIGQRTLYLLVIHDGIKAFDHDKDGADRHGKVLGVDPVAGVHPRFGRRINAGIPLQSAVGFQVVAIGQSLAVFGQDFVDGATVLMQLYGVILVFDGQAVALARNAQISFILRRGSIGIAIEEKIYLLFVCRDTG